MFIVTAMAGQRYLHSPQSFQQNYRWTRSSFYLSTTLLRTLHARAHNGHGTGYALCLEEGGE